MLCQLPGLNPGNLTLPLPFFLLPFPFLPFILYTLTPVRRLATCQCGERELGRLPIRGPTYATRSTCTLALALSVFHLGFATSLAPSSVFRFSACPLVIMAFRTPSDVWPLARSPALIPSYPKSTVGLAIRSIRCLECSLYVWRYCLQKVAKLPRKLRMTWNKELEIQ